MAGQKTINTTTPAVGAIKIQQSTYGLVLPIVWGCTRITGNLIWYGGFKATPHTEVTQSGGKGGGAPQQTSTTYTYSASVAMALCEGPILGIRTAWRGKKFYLGSAYSGTTKRSLYTATYPSSGNTITVPNTNGWVDVSVQTQAGSDFDDDYKRYRTSMWIPLVAGVDYTASGGVYTFNSDRTGPGWQVRITYTYVSTDPGNSCLSQIGLDLHAGTPGQAPWSYLTTNFPSQALGYSSIAYVSGANYQLDDGAAVENHSFEVESAFMFSSTIRDANPAPIVLDALSNPQYGVSFGAEKVAPLTDYTDACTAQGIFLSPALTAQSSAAEFLSKMAALTNVGMVWSNGQLKFIPYTDIAITGNGVTFTPNTTPVYDLTDDDFQTDPPIKVSRGSPGDTFNRVTIEFQDRANAYNIGVATAEDQADIMENGLRAMATIKADWITEASVAKIVAQLILQRSMFVRNTYEFSLGWTKIGLEPMDLVTITDPVLMTKLPVRILSIEEDGDSGYLAVVAEDFPKGSASATQYPSASGAGFAHDQNESPGTLGAPVIFEAPAVLAGTATGLELWLAAGSNSPTYGGCEVWVSLTGSNFQRAAVIHGASRFGATTSALAATSGTTTETVGVSLSAGGQIAAATLSDMNALSTLCYIGGEFIGYESATLTGASAYSLGNHMLRGAYQSTPAAHASGSSFVRCDDAIARMPLTSDYIGKTLHVKVLPFNRYGGGLGDLASATEYTYTITGVQAANAPVVLAKTAADTAKQAADDANAALVIVGADNKLSKGEKPAEILRWNAIVGELSGIRAQADALVVSRTSYDASYTTLLNYLNSINTPPAWTDVLVDTPIVGTDFRTNFLNYYNAKAALLKAIADKIQANAGAAQTTANAAKAATDAIFADGVLDRSEKADLVRRVGEKDGEYTGLVNQAAALSVSSTAYTAANTAVNVYLTGLSPAWNDTTQNTNIVRADANTAWNNYYAAKIDLQNAISAKAAFAPSLVIGGRNLQPDSGFERFTHPCSNKSAAVASVVIDGGQPTSRPAPVLGSRCLWFSSNGGDAYVIIGGPKTPVIPGHTYMLSFYYVTAGGVNSGSSYFYLSNGDVTSLPMTTLNTWDGASGGWQRFTMAWTCPAGVTTIEFRFGIFTVGYGWGAFDCIQVEDGNKVTAWTPAPEDVAADITAAQVAADAANAKADAIAADGILDRSEKSQLVTEWQTEDLVWNQLKTQAAALGVSSTDYTTKHTAASDYLVSLAPGWSDTTQDTAIDRAVYRGKFKDMYEARVALQNAISAKAATLSTQLTTVDLGDGTFFGARNRNDLPGEYPTGTTRQFKQASTFGFTSTQGYFTLETVKQYQDNSGGGVYQYAYVDSKTYRRYTLYASSTNPVDWTAWVLDLDRNAYTGDLNASADLVLSADSAITLNGNTAVKSGGSAGWNAQVTSTTGYNRGAFAEAKVWNAELMFGLNTDPNTNASYETIDHALYFHSNGTVETYRNGSGGSAGTWAAGDTFCIAYLGNRVSYQKNGVEISSIAEGEGYTFFFDSSFYSMGSKLTNIRFGPMTAGTVGAPAGTSVNGVPVETLTNQASAGQAAATTVTNNLTNTFTVSAGPDYSATNLTRGGIRNLTTRTASVSGGTAPYKYMWVEVTGGGILLANATSATVTLQGGGSDETKTGNVQLVVTDAYNRTAFDDLNAAATFNA